MDKLIERLLNSFGVSGRESSIKNIIKSEIEAIKISKKLNMEVKEDAVGNIIIRLGNGREKFMICTHVDNGGILATMIENNGFIRAYPIGNIKPEKLVRTLVKFENGVLGRIDSAKDKPSKDDLFIDLGVTSKEVATNQIKEGDVAEVVGYIMNSNGRVMAPNLHSRLACYIVLEVIKKINDFDNLDKEMYFVFSTQMETGFKGAIAAAYEIKPNAAIVLDALESEDFIGGKGAIKLDKGPIVSIFDKSLVIHHEVREIIENAAQRANVNIQYSIGTEKNEGGVIHKEVGGIKTGMIGVPCRYMYTQEEMISLKDVNSTIDLIYSIVNSREI
ncbi:peptidase M42 [Clostridium sp. JNZ J1-5]